MQGDPKPCGIFLGGTDPVTVDAVAATMMGFDWQKLPVIREGFSIDALPVCDSRPGDIRIVSNEPAWNGTLGELQQQKHFDFKPHFGWKGHNELPNYEG